ncbi:HlyD family efflux transporter periplasmic adaptor subunit [Luteimonas sp. 8-5]|uniref:HlyD family secretion protein n=1 Tax=Luteimonas sp. 8-5 TaxID=3039387 RepID=UPI002436D1DD|nr:HlyD family efflux transporter periplasmic adaptor subunit [Luteimonas sp. 8-5]MDG6348066.1 HlyD family efflux transporter periplasmic adaptor subunit [Luteimonas sp. 8-5]
MNPLFRPEVMEARRQSWLGGISLVQPLRLWVLSCVAIAGGASVVALMALGSYTQRSSVRGQLVPDQGLATVVSPASGVVARLLPDEGAQIRTGQALAVIDAPRTTADGVDAARALRDGLEARRENTQALGQSQLKQIDVQLAGATRQLQASRQEQAQVREAIATRREMVRIGRETLARYQDMAAGQLVSEAQVAQQRQTVLDLVAAQQSLERQATQIQARIAQLQQTLDELPAQRRGLLASTGREVASLEQEQVRQEYDGRLLIKAPVAGMVTNRLIEPGQAVSGGQAVLSILPLGSKLQAQLFVPSRAIGFIDPGDRVELRYQAYPYQKFGHHTGRVARISRSAIAPASGGQDNAEPVYRVLVELDRQTITAYGQAEPLRPGMLVDADILGERRKLYEWVLEPLYSVMGRMGG